jgi:hypothetical protein
MVIMPSWITPTFSIVSKHNLSGPGTPQVVDSVGELVSGNGPLLTSSNGIELPIDGGYHMHFEFIIEHLTDDDFRTVIIDELVEIFRLEHDDRVRAFRAPTDVTSLTKACVANHIRYNIFD